MKLKRINTGEYRTVKPIDGNFYGYVRKNENDFGTNPIWAYGLCEKDFTIVEAIMTTDTKAEAVKDLGEYALKNKA